MRKEALFDFVASNHTDIDRILAAEKLKVDKIKVDPKDEENVLGIMAARSGSSYSPQINTFNGEYQCTCMDFMIRRKMCKHLCALLSYLYEHKKKLYRKFVDAALHGEKKVVQVSEYYPTGIFKLDKLLCGGIPKGKIFGVVGESKIGKTWFAIQMATKLAADGHKVLYIDNEQLFPTKFDDATQRYFSYFEKRWDVPKKIFEKNIDFISPTSLEQFFAYFGLEARIELAGKKSNSKKIDAIITEMGGESIIELGIVKNGYECIIIDSMTSPLKDKIPVSNQNFPARSNLINQLYGKIRDISKKYNKTFIIIHHLTKNEAETIRKPEGEGMWGGYTVKFNSQYVIQIYRHPKYDSPKTRKIIRLIYPGLRREETTLILKDDYGFVSSGI